MVELLCISIKALFAFLLLKVCTFTRCSVVSHIQLFRSQMYFVISCSWLYSLQPSRSSYVVIPWVLFLEVLNATTTNGRTFKECTSGCSDMWILIISSKVEWNLSSDLFVLGCPRHEKVILMSKRDVYEEGCQNIENIIEEFWPT